MNELINNLHQQEDLLFDQLHFIHKAYPEILDDIEEVEFPLWSIDLNYDAMSPEQILLYSEYQREMYQAVTSAVERHENKGINTILNTIK